MFHCFVKSIPKALQFSGRLCILAANHDLMKSINLPASSNGSTHQCENNFASKGPVKNNSEEKISKTKEKKENHSKRILLLALGLALTLSLGSIHWMTSQKSIPPPNKIQASAPVQKVVVPVQQEIPVLPQPEIEPPKTDSVIRIEPKIDEAKKFRRNWSKYIKAENTNYAYGVLGGINDLSVVFTNKTDYVLEELTAKVVYIKSNGKPWKSKYVSVYNIPPHSERKQTLSKVNRGKSVEITISKIVSSAMHFNYSSDKAYRNSDDPYFMK